ncbi:MAG TPA: phosphorylase [Sphingomonadaceae bacterium]|nr:phosphorylase [Sphingomonadaceae bacterium]
MGHVILAATGLRREARLLGRADVIAVAGGGDDARLEAALEARAPEATALLSIGLGGALVEGLRPGDWVLGEAGEGGWPARLRTLLPDARVGPIHADGTMIADAAAKRALHRATGAIAVDMESHVARRVARRHGLPFAILRVISDDAGHSLPAAARVGMRGDGEIAIGAVLASLARDPRQIPALIVTARDAARAMRSLLGGYDMLARFGFGLADLGQFPRDLT